MFDRLHWLAYWNIVFSMTCWFVHETWPIGLAIIPAASINILLRREFEAKLRKAEKNAGNKTSG